MESWFSHPERRTKSQRTHGKDRAEGEELTAEADGNGRDRLGFTWRDCVLAEAAGLNKSST